MRFNRTTITALATVAIAGIGTGSALAATGTGTTSTPAEKQAAAITALAGKLNITDAQLKAALVATAKERVAADLKAGLITQAQADAANARIDAGGNLLGGFGGPGKGMRGGHGGAVGLSTAATFLGLTQAELQTALQGGKTLAAIAKEKGKTSADLVAAIVKAETAKINADTNLTAAQKTQILASLEARVKDHVENGKPAGGPGMGGRGGHGHGGHGMGGRMGGLGAPTTTGTGTGA